MTEEERGREEKAKAFLQCLDRLSRSTAEGAALTKKLLQITDKNTEVSALLFDVIGKDKDGLIAAIDDLIVEIQGLREDFRVFVRSGGATVLFPPINMRRR